MEDLLRKPFAFSTSLPSSSSPGDGANILVSATSRLPLQTKDNSALLNIEIFDFDVEDTHTHTDTDSTNTNTPASILLVLHGVCESAETRGIQAIVSAAKQKHRENFCRTKIAVLELEGHGLSSGRRNVCGDFDRLVGHVLEFVTHAVTELRGKNSEETESNVNVNVNMPYFITGNSLGGVLALYAAEQISQHPDKYPRNFRGLAAICPAVGVDPRAVPPLPIVRCLSCISYLMPALQVPLTPYENPSSYNCPPDTERNFEGHWPLSTSKMLLDVTSRRVQEDVHGGKLLLEHVRSVWMFAGKKDHVVPMKCIQDVYDAVQADEKNFVEIPNADHDLMFHKKTSKIVTDALFRWIESESSK